MLRSCFHLLFALIFGQIFYVAGDTPFPAMNNGRYLFRIDPTPDFAPARLGPGWIDSSSVSCGISCTQQYADCWSFMYNRTTQLCTPASTVYNRAAPPTSQEGDLYYKVTCDFSKGFRLMFSGSAMACLANYQVVWLNYTEAQAACQAEGAVLTAVKTFDKLTILRNLVGGNMAWVGADNLTAKKHFVWQLDFSTVTQETFTSVFAPGQHSDPYGHAYCIQYSSKYSRHEMLNDVKCSSTYGYVCEMPLPFYDNIF